MPSIQTIVALLIVAGAAFLLVRRVHSSLKKGGSPACNCGCSACEATNTCEVLQDHHGPKQTSD